MPALTRAQVREVDRLAVEELGMPGLLLMENAGRNAAMGVLDLLENEMHLVASDAKVVVYCGGGNNGGDGYVIARQLANAGARVAAVAVVDPDKLTGDAAVNCAIAQRMGLVTSVDALAESELARPHVMVDALLGTGFSADQPVREPIASVIHAINALRADSGDTVKVLSVDVPSGLDCDTGLAADPTVVADVTVTFVAVKTGLLAPEAEGYVGQIVEADIGAPSWLVSRVFEPG